ncbi:MAG: hypothetical protein LUC32_06075 [Clostridiales bacterium]|nr:hypothetical protein [Clostridiales bacterium]
MSNQEIIKQAAINAGVITEAQASEFATAGKEIPFHSYKGWKARGFKVKEGEEPTATVTLWQRSRNGNPEMETASPDTGSGKFYRHKTPLYTASQVERYMEVTP